MKSREPLQKVKGLRRLKDLGLPTTEHVILPNYRNGEAWPVASQFIAKYGSVSIRTDSAQVRGGGSPFLFMEKDAQKILAFLASTREWWLIIICEAVRPEDVLVQAHVGLCNTFGRWMLWGEANDQCVRSCREAVAHGTRSGGLRDIWAFDQYREFWARIRRLMLDAGLVNGELAELTIKKDGRLVFWEV